MIALRKCRRLGEGVELFTGCGMEIQANFIRISSGKGPAAGVWVMLDFYFIYIKAISLAFHNLGLTL